MVNKYFDNEYNSVTIMISENNTIYTKKINLKEVDTIYVLHYNWEKPIDLNIPSCFNFIGYSEEIKTDNNKYRVLIYKKNKNGMKKNKDEKKYLNLAETILNEGCVRENRTGINTISSFGKKLEFDLLNESVPVLTTKKTAWKTCIKELLWFMKGDTDSKNLSKQNVKIWEGNTSREFLDSRGLNHLREGDIGASYSFQWRHFGAKYIDCDTDYKNEGIDQLQYVVDTIKKDPFSRRIVLSAWNPHDLEKMALPPCFIKDTPVLTINGYKNIQDLNSLDLVLTHKNNWKRIMKIQEKRYNGFIYEFGFFDNTETIKCTKEHPFYVSNINYPDKEPEWIEAQYIDSNHLMCFPVNNRNIKPAFINNDKQWFIYGYFLKNGWFKDKKAFITIKNVEDVKIFKSYIPELEQINKYIYSFVPDYIFKNLNDNIPEWIQDAEKTHIEMFLGGYEKSKNSYIENFSHTKEVVYGIQRLYAKLGIFVSIYKKNCFYYYKKEKENIKNNLLFYRIKDIKKQYQETIVYNCEVEDDNSYIVENSIVHNCHIMVQFYIEEIKGVKYLSSHMYQRSADFFLGVPFNILSYSILTHIIAKKTGTVAKKLVMSFGDSHIYSNHIEQMKTQIERDTRTFPKILLNDEIKNKDWEDINIDDFKLVGYYPQALIKGDMAV